MARPRTTVEETFVTIADALLDGYDCGKLLIRQSAGDTMDITRSAFNISYDECREYPSGELSDELTAIENDDWDTIICFAPIGRQAGNLREQCEYLFTCLKTLNPKGRLIYLTGASFLSTEVNRDAREKVRICYQINNIIQMPVTSNVVAGLYVLDIRNEKPSGDINYYAFGGHTDIDEMALEILRGRPSFTVSQNDLSERWDVNYLNPEHDEIRTLRMSKDTIKLGDVASIIPGIRVAERKPQGEYLVLTPRLMRGERIDCTDENLYYADNDSDDVRFDEAVLRTGDIVICGRSRIKFLVYVNEGKKTVAGMDIMIIRPRPQFRKQVSLYFETQIGKDSFNEQAEMLSYGTLLPRLRTRDLATFVIPDIKTLELAAKMQESEDRLEKVAMLFEAEGWEVIRNYRIAESPTLTCDIALRTNGEVVGIVETKRYDALVDEAKEQIANYANRLFRMKGIALYLLFIGDKMYRYEGAEFYRIPEIPTPSDYKSYLLSGDLYFDDPTDSSIKELPKEQTSIASDFAILSALETIMAGVERANARLDDIGETVNAIAAQLQELTDRITVYQDLVERQLDSATDNPAMQELIIKAFADTCVERISISMRAASSIEQYSDEERRLKDSIGQDAWGKLGEDAKKFLVSSKYMYAKLADMEDVVDYSGVCLLVTKALELELGKRFCEQYVRYYREAHPGRAGASVAPQPILNQYRRYIRPRDFTLGSFPYLVGYRFDDALSDVEKDNVKDNILEFVKQGLLKTYSETHSDAEILDLLSDYADDVDRVREDYRNPSAHTNALTRISAKECFDLVLDVEKLLKRMLESFDC